MPKIFNVIIITFVIIAMTTIGIAKSYYVSLTGNDSNTGLNTSDSWKTISFAASDKSPVTAGDTVFIKAGDYGNEYIVFETNGTITKPIVFEGYKITPGDNHSLFWEYGDTLDASVMPLLDGGDRTEGIAMKLHSREYIEIRNFQIRNYQYGIYGWASKNVKLENIIVMNIGDINASYDGRGITIGSLASNNLIDNCVVYNACASGIIVQGDSNSIENCRVYSDDNSTGRKSAMDYYINVTGNNNIIENCYAERVGNLAHFGHGIGFKGDCENNIVINCVAKNFGLTGFKVRHRGCKYNVFDHCIAVGCGYSIRDGASYNTFKNCISEDAIGGVYFSDTIEDSGAHYTGRHNVFENCIFQNIRENVIDFYYYSEPSVADSNTFVNCVFNGGNYFFNCDRENNENIFVNCIVTNVNNYYRTKQHQKIEYPLNVIWEYTVFWNNGFGNPAGEKIFSFNPDFIDLDNENYHLNSYSECIDKGTQYKAPTTDFDGIARPQGNGIDLGPFEYIENLSVSDNIFNSSFNVYPNPVVTKILIPNKFLHYSFEIVSLTGHILKRGKIKTNIIDLSFLESGFFLLKVFDKQSKKYYSAKLIKE